MLVFQLKGNSIDIFTTNINYIKKVIKSFGGSEKSSIFVV
jgi:hypothetical protein